MAKEKLSKLIIDLIDAKLSCLEAGKNDDTETESATHIEIEEISKRIDDIGFADGGGRPTNW